MEVDISMETSEKKYFYIFCTHTFRGLSGPSRTVCRCLGNGDGLGAHYGSYCMRSWGRRRQTSCFMCVKMIYLSMCISDNDRNTVMNIIKNFFLWWSSVDTWCSGSSLFEVAVLRTVPPNVTHVATLETTSVLWLPLLLFYVLIFVVFLLLNPDSEKGSGQNKKGWINLKSISLINEQTYKTSVSIQLKTPQTTNTFSSLQKSSHKKVRIFDDSLFTTLCCHLFFVPTLIAVRAKCTCKFTCFSSLSYLSQGVAILNSLFFLYLYFWLIVLVLDPMTTLNKNQFILADVWGCYWGKMCKLNLSNTFSIMPNVFPQIKTWSWLKAGSMFDTNKYRPG